MKLKGNKGEWGELYAFCYLLKTGKLQAADKDLRPVKDIYFPILKIIRDNLSYYPAQEKDERIKIYEGDSLFGEFSAKELEDMVNLLLEEIPKGDNSFEIPQSEEFFDSIKIDKLKADSAHKQDITIQIHDINTGIDPVCGFSIKSYFGGNPSLINAGKSTNFIYRIPGCTKEIMDEFNEISSGNKLIKRMEYLKSVGLEPKFEGMMTSGQFRINLKFIDTMMPDIIGEALINFYSGKVKDVKDVVEEVAAADPCDFGNAEMYKYKMKQFLCACALGMTPQKEWEGGEDANGGYITVKKDGSVLCYHIYNRTDFYEYLYNYTYFEKADTKRHDFMQIFESNGDFYVCLNLQIRFRESKD